MSRLTVRNTGQMNSLVPFLHPISARKKTFVCVCVCEHSIGSWFTLTVKACKTTVIGTYRNACSNCLSLGPVELPSESTSLLQSSGPERSS